MSEELKPCPFCGSKEVEHTEWGNDNWSRIACPDCGVEQDYFTSKESAFAWWNRRSTPAADLAAPAESATCAKSQAAPVQNEQEPVKLAVWYGPMPESNGKSNYAAILHRAGEGIMNGPHITIDRSEYPDRVRYEADRVRHIIGELEEEPDILAYDASLHSGYVKPDRAAPVRAVRLPDVDALSEIIRRVDGSHSLGAGALAEKILEAVSQLNQSPNQKEITE